MEAVKILDKALEQVIRLRHLQLWADITTHYTVSPELHEKIYQWIVSGRLSEKALSFQGESICRSAR